MNVSECDGVVLCGGQGARLRSVVQDVPKVMAEVNGRPFLDYILQHLKAQNVSRVVLCTGYKADMVEEYYRGRDFGLAIDFSREAEPLGTGGALRNARRAIYSDPFFVFNGDSFLAEDLQPFLDFHIRKKAEASIIVTQVTLSQDYGNVKLDDDQRIIEFAEKKSGIGLAVVNAGVYCFKQSIFNRAPREPRFSMEQEVFPGLVGGRFYGFITDKPFMDIGTPERYQSAQHTLTPRGRP